MKKSTKANIWRANIWREIVYSGVYTMCFLCYWILSLAVHYHAFSYRSLALVGTFAGAIAGAISAYYFPRQKDLIDEALVGAMAGVLIVLFVSFLF